MSVGQQCSATIFRGYRSAVERRGLLPAVKERVRAQTAELLAHPPLAIGWVDYDDMNELFRAMGAVLDAAAVRTCGYEAAKETVGPIIAPLIRGTLGLFGASPQGLFGNLGRITSLVLKQTDFVFSSTGPRSGVIEIKNPIPMAPMLFAGWEGAFVFGFEVLGVQGTVGRAEVLDEGRLARVALSW